MLNKSFLPSSTPAVAFETAQAYSRSRHPQGAARTIHNRACQTRWPLRVLFQPSVRTCNRDALRCDIIHLVEHRLRLVCGVGQLHGRCVGYRCLPEGRAPVGDVDDERLPGGSGAVTSEECGPLGQILREELGLCGWYGRKGVCGAQSFHAVLRCLRFITRSVRENEG